MRHPILGLASVLALVGIATGCAPSGDMGPEWGAGGGNYGGGSRAGSSSGAATGSGGASSGGGTAGMSSDGGAFTPPPPPQAPQPGGYQQTLAPLLDAQGCTECHHHGRPIDLTTYPFMAGAPAAAAQQLAGSFGTNMPPSPRTPAPASVIDAVNAWIAGGMKP